jgi:hypothetical protein
MPGFGETYSILDVASREPSLYLIPASALAILILAFFKAKTQAQASGFFWGQVGGVGICVISILMTMGSMSNQLEQYGLEVSPEFGVFILVMGFLAIGIGLVMQWKDVRVDLSSLTVPAIPPPMVAEHPIQSAAKPDFPRTLPASPAARGVHLELMRGQVPGEIIPVLGTDFFIGRGSQNDYVLRDPDVSRQHARLRFAQGSWFIQDQGSKAGVMVNGNTVRAAKIQSGDQITIGETTFIFIDR